MDTVDWTRLIIIAIIALVVILPLVAVAIAAFGALAYGIFATVLDAVKERGAARRERRIRKQLGT